MKSAEIARTRVDYLTHDELLNQVRAAAGTGEGLGVHFVNAFTLSLAAQDTSYRTLLCSSDLNLPDGKPLAWAAAVSGAVPGASQTCGPDFMLKAFETSGLRHFLYGGSPETVQMLAERLGAAYPAAEIVGLESPPFRPPTSSELDDLVGRVRASGANCFWVGLGTPKQDVFVESMKGRLSIPTLAVGAAFDFHAGVKTRPPRWVQNIGFEWLHRFLSEPGRLWKRYLVGNTRFVIEVVRRGVKPVPTSGGPARAEGS